MIAQLIKNFVHLERRRYRLEQNRRANRPARNAEFVLRQIEDVVPNPRFQMALHFWQIKIGTRTAYDELARIMEKIEPKIEQRAEDRFTIHKHVLLIQLPAAWPNEQHRGPLV